MEDDAFADITSKQATLLANFIGEHWEKFRQAAREAGEDPDMIAQKLEAIMDGD